MKYALLFILLTALSCVGQVDIKEVRKAPTTTDPCPNSSQTIETNLVFEDDFENNCLDLDNWEHNSV